MAERKTIDQQITAAQEELKQKENRLKELMRKQKKAERDARTKRLIERGAILESLITDPLTLTNEQIKTFLQRTVGSSYGVSMREKMRTPTGEATAATPETAQGSGV